MTVHTRSRSRVGLATYPHRLSRVVYRKVQVPQGAPDITQWQHGNKGNDMVTDINKHEIPHVITHVNWIIIVQGKKPSSSAEVTNSKLAINISKFF